MAGYDGYSMSNNARWAYECGKMPLSKWTKAAILAAVAEYNGKEFAEAAKPFKAAVLKSALLESLEWHHTSSKYNKTAFYEPKCFDSVEEMLEEIRWHEEICSTPPKAKKVPERWHVKYGVWSGTRKHPKLEWVEADGTLDAEPIEATWFTADDGTRKKTNGNYFELMYKI